MSSTTDVTINVGTVEAHINASGIELSLINESLRETIIGVAGPTGSAGADGIDGAPGPVGAKGDTGAGVPAGGAIGQLAIKQSATDYDLAWSNAVYIDPVSGNVGLGTSAPDTDLHVNAAAMKVGHASLSDTSRYELENQNGRWSFGMEESLNGNLRIRNEDTLTVPFAIERSTNYVGFGTNSPSAALTISNTLPVIRFIDTDVPGSFAHFSASSASLEFSADVTNSVGGSRIDFGVDGVTNMRIHSSGNIGIGTTSPSAKLHVEGAIRMGSHTVATVPSASSSGAGSMIHISDETGGSVMAFSDGTNWRRMTDRAIIS